MNNQILKQQTQGFHDKIEQIMHADLLFKNRFTREHYKQLITHSYRYITAVLPKVKDDWKDLSKLLLQKQQALLVDLKHLHVEEVSSSLAINATSSYYKLGMIYIVLGAMLGNKIILNKLKQYPEFEGYPFAYLSEHQEQLSSLWKDFQTLINSLDSGQLQEVIRGAKDGYLLFGQQ
ncbi:biliverdin-producing heme oxygenase [Sphingobacterium sp. T2]|uniref:biliverdin-producing heme oxygenase n=1 Tax=Sphingobacterium sp. T2 TaxID=1590596 RepID=UPI00057BBA61|nr:biliverdin-producing heme oxygenase [Sphingobacterium sp. T2]